MNKLMKLTFWDEAAFSKEKTYSNRSFERAFHGKQRGGRGKGGKNLTLEHLLFFRPLPKKNPALRCTSFPFAHPTPPKKGEARKRLQRRGFEGRFEGEGRKEEPLGHPSFLPTSTQKIPPEGAVRSEDTRPRFDIGHPKIRSFSFPFPVSNFDFFFLWIPGGLSRWGSHKMTPETQNAHIGWATTSTRGHHSTRRPRRGEKRSKLEAREGRTLRAPTLQAHTFPGFGPPPSASPTLRWPPPPSLTKKKMVLPKIGPRDI